MKRRKIAIICLFIFILSSIPMVPVYASSDIDNSTWPTGPNVYAESAIVMEATTGLVLYEKNMHEKHYPASITKILSALIAIENSSLSDTVTFSRDAIFNVDLDSSRIGIDVGEQLTMQQSLYGILLESANEVTYGVAEHVAGSIPAFAQLMNNRAKELGCTDSNFINPHGLYDNDHYTSAYDMALITREAMKNETFRKIFAARTYQIPPTNIQSETRYLRNHHRFVLKQEYTYDGTEGGKTGYTSKAKYTLVTTVKRGDLELICVIMKDDSFEHQYTDTQKLFNYAYDNFSIYSISQLETAETLNESPMFTRYNSLLSKSETPISIDKKGYLILPNSASFKDAKKEVSFTQASKNKQGDNVVGTISYTYNGKYVGGANILYDEVKSPSLLYNVPDTKNPTGSPTHISTPEEKQGISLRPIIIGVIIALIVLVIALYYVFVELPRLKRRNAYYRKRANRRRYQDDDYLDL
jgi:serine-type D-Ala-D-Ala carboxypeptidase (penicillin-binding protein 5/6)